ncbi:MAG: Glutamine-dependent NAD(+) synthetase, partial [Chlorobi bacterium OLB7]
QKWLEVFLFRFFKISQFKRSCVPNGPKVGSGGSLSPRGDWRRTQRQPGRGLAARIARCPAARRMIYRTPHSHIP